MKEVFLGLDMGGTQIKLGLVDREGNLMETEMFPAKSDLTIQDRLDELVSDIDLKIANYKLLGIGIAFPGIVDNQKNKIVSKYVKYTDAHKADLNSWAGSHWNVPVTLENDARAALIGEWQYGSGKGSNNIVMVTLGTGMGSAVLIEGKLLRGRNFLAGNLGGHMSINFEGDECNCGNVGCVETAASTWALPKNLRKIENYEKSELSKMSSFEYKDIFELASKGDIAAEKLKSKSLEAWSSGIINLLHAYDPELLIIGGGIMKSKNEIIPFFEKRINERSWLPKDSIRIETANQTKYAGILGVCYLSKI
ncbi:ROK family protein [Christiangramia sp. SM2212]|uniref:ROK family protein n=1 Tax=Christiangramia sediminicola TaxID=3073267 RepID=A0ABU1EL00_9FLAO|nr:ROK family protein [Christiangramia sp. SM2212]MDR5589054.1 ROK family protein [Christiangramia sp. SM2212]